MCARRILGGAWESEFRVFSSHFSVPLFSIHRVVVMRVNRLFPPPQPGAQGVHQQNNCENNIRFEAPILLSSLKTALP